MKVCIGPSGQPLCVKNYKMKSQLTKDNNQIRCTIRASSPSLKNSID